MDPEILVVMITCPPARAAGLAELLVSAGHAACVNLVPGVESVYRWEGKLQRDAETLLVVKTTRERFEALKQAVLANHPYEVPEIVGLTVSAGHAPYLDWVVKCTT